MKKKKGKTWKCGHPDDGIWKKCWCAGLSRKRVREVLKARREERRNPDAILFW